MAAGFKSLVDGVGYAVGAPPIPPALGGFIGLLDFTGMSVGSLTSTVVQPDTGELVATGYEPNIVSTTGTRVFPEPGVLTVTAYAPTVETPNAVQPGTAALSVVGYAPQVVVNTVVQPGTAELTATGYAPAMARYVDCALFDSTHITFDSDALTWDLVSTCPVVIPAPAAGGDVGGNRAKPRQRLRRSPPPPWRWIPWLERDVEYQTAPEPVVEAQPVPPTMEGLIGRPGTLPVVPAELPRVLPPLLRAVEPSMAGFVDRMLNAQDVWEALERRQAIEALIAEMAEADDEEALMVLE